MTNHIQIKYFKIFDYNYKHICLYTKLSYTQVPNSGKIDNYYSILNKYYIY